ncbi:MAG: carboxypeptidase-like regulatory domain-containing protein [Ferruginibacter sp.]
MKLLKSLAALLVVFALFTLSSCQKDLDHFVPDNNNIGQVLNPTPVQATVSGVVLDQNDSPVSGATVRSGSNTTTTDTRGLFRFSNITMDKYASVVSVDVNGYFKGIRTFSAIEGSSNYIKIKLTPKSLAGNVDAASGGAVTLPNNSIVTLQANSVVVKSTGQAYTGSINVYAAYIDPTLSDIPQTIPGSFQATDANNFRVLLNSYAMLAVQLEGQSGELLQIATGKTAKLRFTLPTSLSAAAPATIPLWSLNETDGLWKEDGTATKTGNYYEGDVAHFSFWNCDASLNSIYLEMTIQTANGPLTNALVRITRANGYNSSYGYTDSLGNVSGLVPSNESLHLEVLSNCIDQIYSQNIGPFSQDTNLGTITVATPSQLYTLTISGNANDCNGMPVTGGNAYVYWEGQQMITPITNGNFSVTYTRCNASTASVEVVVEDHATQQQSTVWTGSASSGIVNTGPLSACGLTTNEYINYNIDGVNYNLDVTPNYFFQQQILGTTATNLGGINSTDSVHLTMDYANIGVGSSQQLYSFGSGNISTSANSTYAFNPTVNVTISEFGAVGQFISGSFPQTIMTVTNGTVITTYTISGSFRIRRAY